MKRTLILAGVAVLLVAVSVGYFVWFRPAQAERKSETAATAELSKSNFVAAPGVVESASEETEVGAEIPGKLKSVLVEEGDAVSKGQIVAVLENADFAAQVETARAEIATLQAQKETAEARLRQAETDKTRIENGARKEERREALAGYEQTNAVVENARREVERRARLFQNGDVSREEFERARRDFEVAQKQAAAMREKFNFVNADARADDLAKADAAINLAGKQIAEFDALRSQAAARVRAAEANLAKTVVRSPMSGVVLRKRLKDGESVSPENPNGIVTLGDVSILRVRVDVDEQDVARIRPGQIAFVTADAYGEQKFAARVVKIGQILGRKNIRTDQPTERVDRKILEVLLELAPNQKLPLGLRVDAFITIE